MKFLSFLILLGVFLFSSCNVTDDPPEDQVDELRVRIDLQQSSSSDEITFMFSYSLPKTSSVILEIEHVAGVFSNTPIDDTQQSGKYMFELPSEEYPDGEYRYELTATPLDDSPDQRSIGTFDIQRQ